MERRRGKHYTMMRYIGLSSNMGVCCPAVALVDTDLETTVGLLIISNNLKQGRGWFVSVRYTMPVCCKTFSLVILSAAL